MLRLPFDRSEGILVRPRTRLKARNVVLFAEPRGLYRPRGLRVTLLYLRGLSTGHFGPRPLARAVGNRKE